MFGIKFNDMYNFGYNLASMLSASCFAAASHKSIFSPSQSGAGSTGSNDIVVSTNNNSNEKFEDVMSEFHSRIPDRTVTAKQKEDALELIDRMLNTSDITQSLRVYWQDKKQVIQQELMSIQNKEKIGNGDSYFDVCEEMRTHVNDCTKSITEKYLALSFIDRMLACDDIPEEDSGYWTDKAKTIRYEIEHFYDVE